MRKLIKNKKIDHESLKALDHSCRCIHSCSNSNPIEAETCLYGYLQIDSQVSVVGGGTA